MVISVSSFGIEFIKKMEGFSRIKYICSGGYSTIGYGHRILKNETYNTPIEIEQAEELLKKDIKKAEYSVLRYINLKLNNNQFDAITSFTFNVGAAALQRSTLRQKINHGYIEEAAYEFLKWVYIGLKRSQGLILRRKLERELFLKE